MPCLDLIEEISCLPKCALDPQFSCVEERWVQSPKLCKCSDTYYTLYWTLNLSPSAVAKTIKCYNETGSHEDCQDWLRATSAAKDTIIKITSLKHHQFAHINAFRMSSRKYISISSVQRRWHKWGLHGRIATKKPSLKGNNKQNRLARAKKHKEMDIRSVKNLSFVLWSDSNLRLLVLLWLC